ncbi:MAG: DsbA family oxidoreductase [Crocinitomicaceae bacterium]
MKIEIWSDVACPFCYVGKRKFEEALAKFEHNDWVEIEWKSFQLDSTIPKDMDQSIGMYQYLADNKGISLKESKRMHDNVAKMAKEVGLIYDFDRAKISNTFDASRLIHFAKEKGLQGLAKEKLLAAHFTLGLDVADLETLVTIGTEIGLDAEEVRGILTSDAYSAVVRADIQEARNLGISGVPFFVFDRKYGVSGAQDPSVFLETLEKAYQELSAN